MQELFPTKITWPPTDKPLDFYIVMAYWAPGGWWKLFPGLYNKEGAEIKIEMLPRGYTERRVYHIK